MLINGSKLNKVISESIRSVLKESTSSCNDMVFISYGTDSFDPSKFKPINLESEWGMIHNQPHGGLWASPVTSKYGWADWCHYNIFNVSSLGKHFCFTLSPNAKIFVIDGLGDVYEYLTFNKDIKYFILDFKKMINDGYDGIYLTANASQNLRHISFNSRIMGFDSWDVESICVFNPDIVNQIEETGFEKAKKHKYAKPLYDYDDDMCDYDDPNGRKKLQIDSDFELYGNQNIGDTSKIFNGKHPAILAQKHGNSKDAKLARKFNGTIKSGL
jgi:hypothetical protein